MQPREGRSYPTCGGNKGICADRSLYRVVAKTAKRNEEAPARRGSQAGVFGFHTGEPVMGRENPSRYYFIA